MPSCRVYAIINMMDVFNCFLMVFLTLKLIVFKIISQFFNFVLLFFFCLIVTELYFVIMKPSHVFSSVLQVFLFSFNFIWRYFDLVTNSFNYWNFCTQILTSTEPPQILIIYKIFVLRRFCWKNMPIKFD